MEHRVRTVLLTTVSLAALSLAAPATAADLSTAGPLVGGAPLPGVSSVLSLWAAGAMLNSTESDFDKSGYFNFGGDARVAGPSWQLELVAAAHTATDTASPNQGAAHVALAGHWLNRGPDRTWGLFVGGSQTGHQESSDYSSHVFGGAEWAGFYGSNTLFAQAGGLA